MYRIKKKLNCKILFVLDCLDGGGAQRVTINIINAIDKSRLIKPAYLLKDEKDYQGLN